MKIQHALRPATRLNTRFTAHSATRFTARLATTASLASRARISFATLAATAAFVSLAAFAAFATPALRAAPAPAFSITARFPVQTDATSYDYLRADPAARRLYLTLNKTVAVLDLDTGKQVGELTGLSRAHGVAISPDTAHGFATSGQDNKILMFDTKTLATIKTIDSTGSGPDGIEYDPATKRIYVANHGSGQVTVIDPADGSVAGTVDFGEGALEGIAFDGRGHGFVNAENKSAVYVFDLATLKPLAKWPVAPAEGGTGLACDPATHRLFSACANNKMAVLDSDTGKLIATPPINDDPDSIAYDPAAKRIYVPCVEGNLNIFQAQDPNTITPLATVATKRGCRAVTLDAKTNNALTYAPDFGPAPAPVKGAPKRPRPALKPGTFEVLVIGTK